MARKGLTEEIVIDAAARLIAEKGYDNFSLHSPVSYTHLVPMCFLLPGAPPYFPDRSRMQQAFPEELRLPPLKLRAVFHFSPFFHS